MSDVGGFEAQYLSLLRELLAAPPRPDRTGVGTRSLFGRQVRCDLARGYPLLTTKRVFFRGLVAELCWMLRGRTDVAWLQERGVRIWDKFDRPGGLGPVYGFQWRSWGAETFFGVREGGVDQIEQLVAGLRDDPYGRRHVVSAWNVADLPAMALPPCPLLFQCYVGADGRLSVHVYQRSADMFLGVPFDVAEYALLAHLLAMSCGREPGELVFSFGDLHLYRSHEAQAAEQLSREPMPPPRLWVRPCSYGPALDQFDGGDCALEGYAPHGALCAEVAV